MRSIKMKKMLLFFYAIQIASLVTGCNQAPLMQESYYTEVVSGVEISVIENAYGEPYEIRKLANGLQEHSYMQRIALGNSAVEQTEFVFLVDKGKVVGKECKRNGTSCFQFSQ
ncbi:MAG TPA: hypothetical protein VGP47_10830 [Parachlamydiaceae bacterium]|nr:hypothetical protein [Parachlamydiaceae bacterium]